MTKIGSRVIFPSWGIASREFVHYGLGLYELLVPMGQVMDDASNVVDFPS